jgi:hypothetical protein
MSRRGCSLLANASGFDPHRASMSSRCGQAAAHLSPRAEQKQRLAAAVAVSVCQLSEGCPSSCARAGLCLGQGCTDAKPFLLSGSINTDGRWTQERSARQWRAPPSPRSGHGGGGGGGRGVGQPRVRYIGGVKVELPSAPQGEQQDETVALAQLANTRSLRARSIAQLIERAPVSSGTHVPRRKRRQAAELQAKLESRLRTSESPVGKGGDEPTLFQRAATTSSQRSRAEACFPLLKSLD